MRSTIEVIIRGERFPTDSITFPAGEIHCFLTDSTADAVEQCEDEDITVLATIRDSAGVLAAAQIIKAVEALSTNTFIDVYMPYFPSSRQDRICNRGEAPDREVIMDLFNGYDICTLDMHSPSDNVESIPQWLVLEWFLDKYKEYMEANNLETESLVLLGPDYGSSNKMAQFVLNTKHNPRVGLCKKVRDPKTGELSGFEVPGDLEGKDVVICDDICDGGGTFLGLAEVIKEQGPKSLTLLVTHGIFSKGVLPLLEVFDGVVCTDSIVEAFKIRQELAFSESPGLIHQFHIIPFIEYTI